MKKVLFSLLAVILIINGSCFATDRSEELLSLVNLKPEKTTRQQVTGILGTPGKIEDGKKRTTWLYNLDNINVSVYWNKASDLFEKCSFTSTGTEKCVFDSRMAHKLQSGTTNISQTIALLGMPQNLTIRSSKQELHYSYQNNVLRLFFRNNVLVDFTLQGKG